MNSKNQTAWKIFSNISICFHGTIVPFWLKATSENPLA